MPAQAAPSCSGKGATQVGAEGDDHLEGGPGADFGDGGDGTDAC